tara:strand:- start:16 stop:135 length:120 start_codon:yes stop_codon:yes gene_type:complete
MKYKIHSFSVQIKAIRLLDVCIVIDLASDYKREALETLN